MRIPLPTRLVDHLIERAARTPYHHLPGYMRRDWLVPFRKVCVRHAHDIEPIVILGVEVGHSAVSYTTTDGTGPVPFRERPIAWSMQQLDVAARVHHIFRSDRDRNPHCHPGPYVTVVMRGGYWETLYDDDGFPISRKWHGPGSILYHPANTWHRLDVPPGQTTVTLFVTWAWIDGAWGFNVNGKKVAARDYERKQQ